MAITNQNNILACQAGQDVITPEISDRHDIFGNTELEVIVPDDSLGPTVTKKIKNTLNSPDANTTFVVSPINLTIYQPAGPLPQIVARYKYLAQKISDESWLEWTQAFEYPAVFPTGYTPTDYIVIGVYDIFKELIQP